LSLGLRGGGILNEAGEQIGMLAWRVEQQGEYMDRAILLDFLLPTIDQGRQAGPPPQPGPGPTPGPTPPQPARGSFGAVTFGLEVRNDSTIASPQTQFPAGTRRVYGSFPFQAVPDGTRWGNQWLRDGKVEVENRDGWTWKNSTSSNQGANWVYVNNDRGLTSGQWELRLFLEGQEVQRAGFTVAGSAPAPQPGGGVVLRGSIHDADTRRGIPNATFWVLEPGLSVDEWAEMTGDEGNAAIGNTDLNGQFQTAPPLERGQTYTVMVSARDYQSRQFIDGLQITNDDKAVLNLDPIALKRK
jgi:hypothetical protein